MTDNPANLPLEDEVSDEAFADLVERVADLADAMRRAVSRETLATAIHEALQPTVAAMALRQRDIGGHTLH